MQYYSISELNSIEYVKKAFPDGKANELNFVLFSTSGVHGTYTTIEDIEYYLEKYPNFHELSEEKQEEIREGEDGYSDMLTILIIRPRVVEMVYGNIQVKKEDIPYLKRLRETSIDAVNIINEKEKQDA